VDKEMDEDAGVHTEMGTSAGVGVCTGAEVGSGAGMSFNETLPPSLEELWWQKVHS